MDNVLLINPWIYDFAAYDLWAKPLGLLYIASILKECGLHISYLDCLDRYDPDVLLFQKRKEPLKNNSYFCGKYFKREITKPLAVKDISRAYFQYGIPPEIILEKLKKLPKPKVIFLTSLMTYWYLGTFEMINFLKKIYPDTPIILGGIYPSLAYNHCLQYSRADFIFKGSNINDLLKQIKQILPKITIRKDYHFLNWPYPAVEYIHNKKYLPLMTSVGCPYHCTYCAKDNLNEKFIQRPAADVSRQILFYIHKYHTQNIAFYDDALLINPKQHIIPILDNLIKENISSCHFHTPNGLHANSITQELAEKMFQAGFKTIRLSFETSSEKLQKETGGKVTNNILVKAVAILRSVGFNAEHIDVYTMLGIRNQTTKDILNDIIFINSLGAKAILAAYSPIPETKDWQLLKEKGEIDDRLDPLWHNNTIYSQRNKHYNLEIIKKIRLFATKGNKLVMNNQYDIAAAKLEKEELIELIAANTKISK